MAIIGIVAISENYAIGKDGKLPWHYSSDLKFFKRTTIGNAVVMGFNTWKSIGKRLPKRLNIVISRVSEIENQPGVILVRSKKEVLELSEYLDCDIFIIGGAETYYSFAELIDKWIVTQIPLSIEKADAFMPKAFLVGFEMKETQELEENVKVSMYDKSCAQSA